MTKYKILFLFSLVFSAVLPAFERPSCEALNRLGLSKNEYEAVLIIMDGKSYGFIGPPGAGKGTAATSLKKHTRVLPLSVGDMLREIRDSGSDVGAQIGTIMKKGDLVPSELLEQVYSTRFGKLGSDEPIIVDGAPRKEEEIPILMKALNSVRRKLDAVFYFDTSKEVAVKRQQGRRVCTNCKASFHIETMPPKKEGICDHCGTALTIRADDSNAETILHRHEVFESEVEGIVRELSTKGLLYRINSNGDSDQTMREVYDAILHPDKYRMSPTQR